MYMRRWTEDVAIQMVVERIDVTIGCFKWVASVA